jgi:hypothetical protein
MLNDYFMKHNFQLVAGHLALDFVNTLDWRFDPEHRVDLLPDYESFLEFALQSMVISATEFKTLARTNLLPGVTGSDSPAGRRKPAKLSLSIRLLETYATSNIFHCSFPHRICSPHTCDLDKR